MTNDSLGKYLSEVIEKAPGPTANIVKILKDTKTDVVLIICPSVPKWPPSGMSSKS